MRIPTKLCLYYGGIKLIPMHNRDDIWHIPGQRVATTEHLVRLATSQSITVRLTEQATDGQTTIRLN